MAFAVTWDGTRVTDAETTTGWTADNVTPNVENDFFYQGTASISAQVKTTEAGIYYTSASQDLTGRTWLCKVYSGKLAGLDGNGLLVRVGSGTGAYHQYNLFSASTYPFGGGWQVVAINPNVSQWRTSTTGSPNLAAATYWAIRADYNANSRATNTAMDAIDHIPNGGGLTGTGNTPGGSFDDFVTFDEGTSTNRYGVVQTRDGVLYVNSVLTIGSSATATTFTAANDVVVFTDGLVTTGACGLDLDIQNASSSLSITNCVFKGVGALTGSDDTRPDYLVVGTSGTCTITGTTFDGFRLVTYTSVVDALSCNYDNGLSIVAAGADMRGSSFSGCTGAADSSYLTWNVATDPDGLLDSSTFAKGTTDTHAIEFGTTSPTTMTLRGIAFGTGYSASNAQNSSTLYFARTTGTVTVNLIGCSGNISYKTAGATIVFVIDPVTTTVTARDAGTGSVIQNARVLLYASDGTGPLPYQKSVTSITRSGSTATVTSTAHGLVTNDYAIIEGADQSEYNGVFQITRLTDDTFTYTVSGTPVTPATGTITLTGVALYGLTNVSGVASASRSYSSSQPVTGWVRRATLADGTRYKQAPISGTVSNTTGFSTTAQLVRDE